MSRKSRAKPPKAILRFNSSPEVSRLVVVKAGGLTFMKKALRCHGSPEAITTAELRSYKAAMDEFGNRQKQEVSSHANNGVENSHLSFRQRERPMLRFRRMASLQRFASAPQAGASLACRERAG